MLFKKSKNNVVSENKLFGFWTNYFPDKNNRYSCKTLEEAFLCLLSILLDH